MCDPQQIIFLNTATILTAIMAALAAIFSGICAFLSYQLSKKIRDELKSDEKIIVNKAVHPDLINHDHRNSVLVCAVFNKSKRKAHIKRVVVLNPDGKPIDVTWSKQASDLGNPELPCQLIGVVDTENIYIRRNDGEWFHSVSIAIYHSFSNIPETINFEG